MADEISLTSELTVLKDGLQATQSVRSLLDQTTAGYVSRGQSIPTSDTVITLSGVTTPKAVCIENLDETNYVKIGPTSGGAIVPIARLSPRSSMVVELEPGVVLRGQANGSAVNIAILIVET